MSNEILFVQTVQKYECLYNNNIPEYNRKDMTEQAWGEVAKERNLTVNECKEKWRNIRSSFLRSTRKSEKTKKPYYLSPYLQFVVPFTKRGNQVDVLEEQNTAEYQMSDDNDVPFKIDSLKTEIDSENEGGSRFVSVGNDIPVAAGRTVPYVVSVDCDPLGAPRASVLRRRRRQFISRSREESSNIYKRKPTGSSANLSTAETSRLNNSSMRYFLLSLLPDFDDMREDQIRTFKIKVMMLIEEIKTNFQHVRQNLNTSGESERLQKRLINLLIKNLKKTT